MSTIKDSKLSDLGQEEIAWLQDKCLFWMKQRRILIKENL